jgi:hypothetical protein
VAQAKRGLKPEMGQEQRGKHTHSNEEFWSAKNDAGRSHRLTALRAKGPAGCQPRAERGTSAALGTACNQASSPEGA